MKKILVVDDDIAIRTSLSLLLEQNSYSIDTAEDPEEAIDKLSLFVPDLVLLDMNFSLATTGEEGLQLLKKIKELNADLPVILMTAWGSIDLAVQGMRAGAANFLTKPWTNENVLKYIETALHLSESKKTVKSVLTRDDLDKKYNFQKIIGKDPAFLRVLDTIGTVSNTNASVLLIGESGTGKELIAEAVHHNSKRKNQPFVKVNLGGISSSLFESEMFGHNKGAFTDAKRDRVGRFEMANRGSIFLDEIGELDLNSQVKLLRVLQDQSFEVLGSSYTKQVDIRVISATNRNLEEMVEKDTFREDLFYRINLITIKIPSLRERKGDIPLLVNHFVDNLKKSYGKDDLLITKAALNWLKDLAWPGNIRELKNLVERVVLISNKEVLDVEDFSAQYKSSPKKQAKGALPAVGTMTIDEMEKNMILKALKFHKNNMSKVAKSLGLSRAALYRRLEKYDIR